MHSWGYETIGVPLFMGPLFGFFIILALWSIFWKGLGLWHAGQRGQAWWFVIMLVVNTAGILEIIYLFFVLKLRLNEVFVIHTHHDHPHDHHEHHH